MSVDMEAKLNKWQQKLLDLGKRNANINFRYTKSSTLQIVKPDIGELWNRFVVKENTFKFRFKLNTLRSNNENLFENSDVDEVEEYEVYDKEEYESRTEKNLLVSSQTLAVEDKILRNLKNKSKTFYEEQGINVLYLCFGFLHYEEGYNWYDAPLILVPVKLINDNIVSPFELSLHDDEIVINPTLCYKLSNEYNLNLPEFKEDDDLESYFSEIENLVSNNGWSVKREVGLGILHFTKISMYYDLLRNANKIKENGLIKSIGGDSSVDLIMPPDFSNLDENELLKPKYNFQVVDADSSQQEAIICAKSGVSFVLQGPPGTGKSQTITNIITECLATGKKVLFVSEKMAALEVVHKRLKEAHLDEFCLIMHSHKMNKKKILEQFGDVLKLSDKKYTVADEALEKLSRLEVDKRALNNYARDINTKIEPLKTTIFEVNAKLSKLQDMPDLIFGLTDVRHIDCDKLHRMHNVIQRYAGALNDMCGGIESNPWNGCTIPMLTHERNQDISYHLTKLIQKLNEFQTIKSTVFDNLKYRPIDSQDGMDEAETVLSLASAGKNVPSNWILGDDINPFEGEISACKKTKEKFIEIRNRILALHQNITSEDKDLDFSDYTVLSNSDFISALYLYLDKIINGDVIFANLKAETAKSTTEEIERELDALESNATAYNDIKTSLSQEYEKEIFNIDYNGIYQRFKTDYTWGILNFLKSSYRADNKMFKGLLKKIGQNINDSAIIKTLADLRSMEENLGNIKSKESLMQRYFGEFYRAENTNVSFIRRKIEIYKLLAACRSELDNLKIVVNAHENQENILKNHYENLYSGIETDWDSVRSALEWAQSFKKSMSNVIDNKEFVTSVCVAGNNRANFKEALGVIRNWNLETANDFTWLKGIFEERLLLTALPMEQIKGKLQDCLDNLTLLEKWIDYRNAKAECAESDLSDFVTAIENEKISGADLKTTFDKRFYKLWLDSVLPEFESVANFRGNLHSSTVSEFKQLDREQFEISKCRIRVNLINSLPAFNAMTTGKDDVAILRREMNKQRRIKPIRKLFAEIPKLVMMLKPCLMMSPLTVSLFLESDEFQFDTVIFDEASQVCTENAIGAILRGKQVIIAGDSKQLPPTNFFRASMDNGEYDEYDEDDETNNDVFESLLDEAALLPTKTLLWHYRSRHEHLIAYSNAKIYNNSLVTFPSNIEGESDTGVQYVYLPNGFYDRGGKKGNVIEAAKVADMVFEHFQKCRDGVFSFDRSLGVITFGQTQADAVETALRRKRQECPEFEEYFSEDLEEAFFVKSLENVQGDERDTIIFSIGYAKDSAGVMRMSFGPLSQSGGERRLNVAITRAKYNVKLVGSILPSDIDTDKISSDGPKLLKGYIDFAMRGMTALDSEITDSDVLSFDSPFEESVYNFLVSKGYKLRTQVGCSKYRIDLGVRHPDIPGTYVLGIECDGASYHSAKTARERDRLRQDVLENMGWRIYRIWSTDWIKSPVSEGNKLIKAIDSAISEYGNPVNLQTTIQEEVNTENIIEGKDRVELEGRNPSFADYPNIATIYASRISLSNYQLKEKLSKIITAAYPIHVDMLYQECCSNFGYEKVTTTVKRKVDTALNEMKYSFTCIDNFYYPKGKEYDVPLRVAGPRKIDYISETELALGIMEIAKQSVGISKDGLMQSTSVAFGFKRRGPAIMKAMKKSFDNLEREGKLKVEDGKVIVLD